MFTGCRLVSLTMPMPYLYHYIILYLCKIQNEIPLNLVNSYNLMRKNHEQHRKSPWNPILNPYNTHRRFFLGAPVPQMHLLQGIPANRFGGTEQVKRKKHKLWERKWNSLKTWMFNGICVEYVSYYILYVFNISIWSKYFWNSWKYLDPIYGKHKTAESSNPNLGEASEFIDSWNMWVLFL